MSRCLTACADRSRRASSGSSSAGCLPTSGHRPGPRRRDLWTVFLVAGDRGGCDRLGAHHHRDPPLPATRFDSRGAADRRSRGTPGSRSPGRLVPILIVLVLFVLTLVALHRIDARTEGGIDVNVTAFRWQWQFDYPGDPASRSAGLPEVAGRDGRAGRRAGARDADVAPTSSTRSTCRSSCSSATRSRDTRPSSTSRSRSRGRTAASAPSSAASTTTACRFTVRAVPRAEYEAVARPRHAGRRSPGARSVEHAPYGASATAPAVDRVDLTTEVGGLIGWLTTTDHKRIGILYISSAFVLFLRRRRCWRW